MKWFGRRNPAREAALPVLSTERLVLRGFDVNDAVSVFAYTRSGKIALLAGFKPHETLEESRKMVESFIEKGESWAIVEKSTGRLIGSVCLQPDGKRPKLSTARSMGYMLSEESWGKGYATEACREVLRYAFEEMGCDVISSGHIPINTMSRRVIKKLGFVLEGTVRCARPLPDGTVADQVNYSLLRSEYEAQKLKSK